jgi:hypothetical protein
MEKHHVPTVYFTTSQFNENAHLSAEDNGVPKMRIIALPADKYYSQRLTKERVKPVAVAAFDPMIEALTRPLTDDEANPKSKVTKRDNVKVTGESEAAALENFNELFAKNHWSDGLPLVPPIPERVKWMLSGTKRSPGEKLGTVSPRNGMATVENVAINAVMAGAKPEYFPVILAAMDALVDDAFDDLHFLTSTGSFNLVITVSGAIAKEIDMNAGLGMLSYGSRANLAIGRAVRLATINLGHNWPGENDMALVGRPNPITFMVVAENQEYSPWEPYHVSQGFKAEDSCVTLDVVGSTPPAEARLPTVAAPSHLFLWNRSSTASLPRSTVPVQREPPLWASSSPLPGTSSYSTLKLHRNCNRDSITRARACRITCTTNQAFPLKI